MTRGRDGITANGAPLLAPSSAVNGGPKGELGGRLQSRRDTFGLFDRPSMGASVAFRRDSMAATLYAVQNDSTGDKEEDEGSSSEDEYSR